MGLFKKKSGFKRSDFIFRVDARLDFELATIMRKDIISVEYSYAYVAIDFGGITVRFWNNNKYYAWASRGTIQYYGYDDCCYGKNFEWDNCMPNDDTLNELDRRIKEFTNQN